MPVRLPQTSVPSAEPVFQVDQTGAPFSSANPMPVTTSTFTVRTAKGYQQITSLSSAAALTPPAGSTFAVIACEAQGVRWRDDGTNPTASVGVELLVGQSLLYDGPLSAIKFIEETASAKLNVSYYA